MNAKQKIVHYKRVMTKTKYDGYRRVFRKRGSECGVRGAESTKTEKITVVIKQPKEKEKQKKIAKYISSVAPLKRLYFHWTAICSSSIVFTPRSCFFCLFYCLAD